MKSNTVAYEEGSKVELENELFLEDAISDLPPVYNADINFFSPNTPLVFLVCLKLICLLHTYHIGRE